MKYRLWDASGFLIAEVKFHSRTSESVMVEYITEMARSVGAATYSPVAIEDDDEDDYDEPTEADEWHSFDPDC